MRVLRNLPDQRLAVPLRHPVLGLDLHIGIDPLLERALLGAHVLERAELLGSGVDHLCVHPRLLKPPGLAAPLQKRYTFFMVRANSVSRSTARTDAARRGPDPRVAR